MQTNDARRAAALKEAARWIAKLDARAKSGGPKTEAGKQVSSRNARKHGITSRDIERRIDEGLETPQWLFVLGNHLRIMADEDDPFDALLVRKALIAAWRHGLAQDALDMEVATSLHPSVELNKTHNGWASDAIHGVDSVGSLTGASKARKMSGYAARFRSERDNAIRMLRRRSMDRLRRG
ncbi:MULTISPECIES: hypothetical protein [Pseudomonadota]|uniref:hypothetical protein n=1 Tax=Pseudomonadota TaxID=1224 RepID=UPI0022CC4564|nr:MULTISPECIES: hypothetical protein [Pseudomonadota]MCZ8074460.1 hypothetical protein [Roseateles sp.]MCZ8095008.1 hypothetical protein [Acidovorax sp.]MCZ8227683.1 hypothetical protein [Burkholderiaceae bacterium]MCZ8017183.1 hypothetical protein [Limnobacter sp.]MCZ8233306.1 hypothetical protein [Novosphingobium sp.]